MSNYNLSPAEESAIARGVIPIGSIADAEERDMRSGMAGYVEHKLDRWESECRSLYESLEWATRQHRALVVRHNNLICALWFVALGCFIAGVVAGRWV